MAHQQQREEEAVVVALLQGEAEALLHHLHPVAAEAATAVVAVPLRLQVEEGEACLHLQVEAAEGAPLTEDEAAVTPLPLLEAEVVAALLAAAEEGACRLGAVAEATRHQQQEAAVALHSRLRDWLLPLLAAAEALAAAAGRQGPLEGEEGLPLLLLSLQAEAEQRLQEVEEAAHRQAML